MCGARISISFLQTLDDKVYEVKCHYQIYNADKTGRTFCPKVKKVLLVEPVPINWVTYIGTFYHRQFNRTNGVIYILFI